LGREYR